MQGPGLERMKYVINVEYNLHLPVLPRRCFVYQCFDGEIWLATGQYDDEKRNVVINDL